MNIDGIPIDTMVKQKINGSVNVRLRKVMDFSQLNKDVTIHICHMPSIDEIKMKMSRNGLMFICDLANYFDIFPYAGDEWKYAGFTAPYPIGPCVSLRAEYGQPNIMLLGQSHSVNMFKKPAPRCCMG